MPEYIVFFEPLVRKGHGKAYYTHNGVEFAVDSAKLEPHQISVDGAQPFDSIGTSCSNGGVWPFCNKPL